MSEFPLVADLVPHEGEMILLAEVTEHEEDATVCRAAIGADGLFADAGGHTGSWLGLEMMAQCIAVHSGLAGRREGRPPRIGFLLSSRRLRFASTRYHEGQVLRVRACHVWGEDQGMVSFDCSIRDEESGDLMAEGRLNCFLPESEAELRDVLGAGVST